MRALAFTVGLGIAIAATPAAPQAPAEISQEKAAILQMQVHGYLDALIELQAKLARREAEWAFYSRPLWEPPAPTAAR